MFEQLMAQFQSLDTDGSGYISIEEMMNSMPVSDREKARGVIEMMDVDTDGEINYAEFVSFYLGDDAQDNDALSTVERGYNLTSVADLPSDLEEQEEESEF